MTSRIVLIEDDPDIAMVVQAVLVDLGHEVDVRSRLVYGTVDRDVKLVVSDLIVVGGYDLATARAWTARVRAAFPEAAVILLTAHEQAALAGGPTLGVDAVLAKPFDFGVLVRTVESLLGG